MARSGEIIQRAGLITLEMRDCDVTELRRADDVADRFEGLGKRATESGLHQRRLIIIDQKKL